MSYLPGSDARARLAAVCERVPAPGLTVDVHAVVERGVLHEHRAADGPRQPDVAVLAWTLCRRRRRSGRRQTGRLFT